jgi:Na+/H+-dicarboxylate symporter
MSRLRTRGGRSHLGLGVILLCIGAVLLALNLGLDVPWHLWKYFPIPMIAFGLWEMLTPAHDSNRVRGLGMLTHGIYCLISVFGLFGLGWATAWPIYIVSLGIAVLARQDFSLFCTRLNKDVDESHRSEPQVTNDR